jgi:hypothetical protein
MTIKLTVAAVCRDGIAIDSVGLILRATDTTAILNPSMEIMGEIINVVVANVVSEGTETVKDGVAISARKADVVTKPLTVRVGVTVRGRVAGVVRRASTERVGVAISVVARGTIEKALTEIVGVIDRLKDAH